MSRPPQKGRVLVIDDQETTRYVFRRILTNGGYEVQEAMTGTDGLTKAVQIPDVIIADVNLPDMLGYDLVRRLKSNPSTSSIPVLQISASFISDESKVQALEGGADSYLIQPVEPTVLLAQIQALMRMRKAEALSHLSSWQWQTTFDALSDGLAMADSDGILVRANRAFLHLLNLTPSETEGRLLAEIFESNFGFSLEKLADSSGADHAVELSFGSLWFRVRYDRVLIDPSRDSGAILLLTDITHHRKLQETLKMTERLAATGRLAHIIAHEINNPLEALANLLYLVEIDPSLSESSQGFVKQSLAELERISKITKQILAYHRESKQPIVTRGRELLEGVLAMLYPNMIVNQVELRSRFADSRCVRVLPGEIRQAFGNLVSNAVDAMGGSGGRLRVGCFDAVDYPTGRKGVRFLFSDTGCGIPRAASAQIFDAFFTTKELKGSGIGLWLTSEIIAKHSGRIRVRSRTKGPYRGSLFDMFLPEHDAEQAAANTST
jgi:signal transduction histidine kinase